MKLLARLAILLALALIVVGGLLALNQSDWASSLTPAGPDRAAMTQTEGGGEFPAEFDGSAPPERGEQGAPGGLIVMELVKNLIIMAVIVTVVGGFTWLWQRLPLARLRRTTSPPAIAAPNR